MNTFSKTIAPSIRAGYLVLPRSCMALYEKKKKEIWKLFLRLLKHDGFCPV